MMDPLPARDSFEDLGDLVRGLGRREHRNMPSDDLLGFIAEDSLRAPVPTPDDAVQILADDGVVRRFDNGGQALPKFGSVSLSGDVMVVSERAQFAGIGAQL